MNAQPRNASNALIMEVKPTALSTVKALTLLANTTRLGVLISLGREPLPVGDLAQELGLDSPTVSRALRQLRKAKLVRFETVKKQHIYRVSETVAISIHASLIQIELLTTDGRVLVETQRT